MSKSGRKSQRKYEARIKAARDQIQQGRDLAALIAVQAISKLSAMGLGVYYTNKHSLNKTEWVETPLETLFACITDDHFLWKHERET